MDEILTTCMEGYGLASGLVWGGVLYVFTARRTDAAWRDVQMSHSADLAHWTEPKVVVSGQPDERVYNQSVCYDGERFVMTYESGDPAPSPSSA